MQAISTLRSYLIGHGETISNANRTVQFGDTPLSERGLEQARQLGEYMRVERAWTQVRDYAAYSATGDFAVMCHALIDRCVTVPRALIPADGIRFGKTAVTVIDGDTNTVSVLGSTAHLSAEHITYPNHPKGL